jgi:DNA end-binding protein Ku
VTIGGREWLIAVAPVRDGDGRVMAMLRYADELRDPKDFFDQVPTEKPQKDMVDLAVQLITQKSAAFLPEKFVNHYQEALRQLVKDKLKGKKIIAAPEGPKAGGNVVDLMEALRKSVAGKAKPKVKSGKKSA